jgi:transposase
MPKRKKYSAEFKREAVALANTSSVSTSQVARELGIGPNLLTRWCRESARGGDLVFQGQGKTRDEEITALKRELARVKKERDFLKEAAAFFAKESK